MFGVHWMKRKEFEFRVTRMPDVAIPIYKPCTWEADVGGYGFKTSLEYRVSSKLPRLYGEAV